MTPELVRQVAILKNDGVELELVTDPDMHRFVERGLIGVFL